MPSFCFCSLHSKYTIHCDKCFCQYLPLTPSPVQDYETHAQVNKTSSSLTPGWFIPTTNFNRALVFISGWISEKVSRRAGWTSPSFIRVCCLHWFHYTFMLSGTYIPGTSQSKCRCQSKTTHVLDGCGTNHVQQWHIVLNWRRWCLHSHLPCLVHGSRHGQRLWRDTKWTANWS